jgi:hypothetical protein
LGILDLRKQGGRKGKMDKYMEAIIILDGKEVFRLEANLSGDERKRVANMTKVVNLNNDLIEELGQNKIPTVNDMIPLWRFRQRFESVSNYYCLQGKEYHAHIKTYSNGDNGNGR